MRWNRPRIVLAVAAVACGLLFPAARRARADTIELKDGRIVEGLVIPAKDPTLGPGLYVVSRFGPTFLKASEIKTRHAAKPVDEQIHDWLARLEPRDVKNRVRLAAWMKKIGRVEEAHALARQVLVWDPENADAHALLGHVRHRGRWMTPAQAKRADGYVEHGGRWYTPQEWRNVSEAGKKAAQEADRKAAAQALQEDVNRAVRLALSPDPAVRARGKGRLEALAKELDSDRLRKLVKGLDAYLESVDELRRKALAVQAGAADGMVMGEIRVTLSRLKRPIKVLETNLASGPIGANAPVRIQLPELEVIRVMTTMAMPAVVR